MIFFISSIFLVHIYIYYTYLFSVYTYIFFYVLYIFSFSSFIKSSFLKKQCSLRLNIQHVFIQRFGVFSLNVSVTKLKLIDASRNSFLKMLSSMFFLTNKTHEFRRAWYRVAFHRLRERVLRLFFALHDRRYTAETIRVISRVTYGGL